MNAPKQRVENGVNAVINQLRKLGKVNYKATEFEAKRIESAINDELQAALKLLKEDSSGGFKLTDEAPTTGDPKK